MSDEQSFCTVCDEPIQGKSELCISCFRRLHRPCPRCMDEGPRGSFKVKREKKTRKPVNCSYCGNDRWIIAH
jgi:predicted amidophosphoribosyltransferase